MSAIIQLFNQHPFWATAITTWIGQYGVSAFVSALEAPDATSSKEYRFFFRFITAVLAQNPSRAGVVKDAPKAP